MKIKEFADVRGIDAQAISRYMKRHGMSYDRNIGLTEKQLSVLAEKYPLPKPIYVVQDEELLRENSELKDRLLKAQEAILSCQTELNRLASIEGLYEANKVLLEDKKALLEEKDAAIKSLKNELAAFEPSWFGLFMKKPKS